MANTQVANITFHGQQLITVQKDGIEFVAMKPICENIGLQWEAQYKRINRHPVLKASMSMMDIQMPGDDQKRSVLMLPVKMLNGWLFGVDVNRVNEQARPLLIQYQEECFDALFNYWNKGIAINQNMTITPAMQHELHVIVSQITADSKKPHGMVWGRFKNHFKIAKYDQLPIGRFEEAKLYLVDTFLAGKAVETVPLYDISGALEPQYQATIQLPDNLDRLAKEKAYMLSHDFFEKSHDLLLSEIAGQCEVGWPRRLNEELAAKIIEQASIDSLLSAKYRTILQGLGDMAKSISMMASKCSSDISAAMTSKALVA